MLSPAAPRCQAPGRSGPWSAPPGAGNVTEEGTAVWRRSILMRIRGVGIRASLLVVLAALGPPPTRAGDPPPSAADVADRLRPGGAGGYEEIDWGRVPPWRQTAFFGVR